MTLPLRIFTEPQQGASYDTLLSVAKETERLGFDAFFRSDHFLRIGGVAGASDGRPGPTDSWVTLAGLARETSRIRLGTLVTSATFRLPGPLAVAVAEVDAMSGGRVELGLGAGWYEEEHAAYGIPFPSLAERFDRFEEQLAIITGLWTTPEGKRFSFEGRHYRLQESPALPKPFQQPHPPIIVGGAGPRRTPALAAAYAAEFNVPPYQSFETFTATCDRGRAACEAAGRDPASMTFSVALTLCCGADEREVERRAAAIGRDAAEARRNTAIVAGTPEEVAEHLRAYQEAGAERVYLQVLDLDDLDHLRLTAESVVPQLR
jgi:F420-dependent oxidoreductase-like protein